MTPFKAGDRVVVIEHELNTSHVPVGSIGTVVEETVNAPCVNMDDKSLNDGSYRENPCAVLAYQELVYEREYGITVFEEIGFEKLLSADIWVLGVNDEIHLEYTPDGIIKMEVRPSLSSDPYVLELPHIKTIGDVKQLYTSLIGKTL